MIDFSIQRYAFLALASAALFGISTPLAKILLADASPVLLAGLLYLGGGLGLGIAWLARAAFARQALAIVRLQRSDLPWLAGAVLSGGILAPVLLLWGLAGMSAGSAALLLNAEAVLTALVSAVLFREAVGARVWMASLVMLGGGILLAWQPDGGVPVVLHAAAVLAACLLWGVDNNLTRNIAASDALTLAMVKCGAAGTVNFALGAYASAALPAGWHIAAAMVLGAASYGASLVLYVIALRHLGSARTGAHFATAPFIGAAVAIALGEPLTGLFVVALAMMAGATWLVLTEHHAHPHTHVRLEHAHRHRHDQHHRHEHDATDVSGEEAHSHWHVHEPVAHSHAHLPDVHHRHRH